MCWTWSNWVLSGHFVLVNKLTAIRQVQRKVVRKHLLGFVKRPSVKQLHRPGLPRPRLQNDRCSSEAEGSTVTRTHPHPPDMIPTQDLPCTLPICSWRSIPIQDVTLALLVICQNVQKYIKKKWDHLPNYCSTAAFSDICIFYASTTGKHLASDPYRKKITRCLLKDDLEYCEKVTLITHSVWIHFNCRCYIYQRITMSHSNNLVPFCKLQNLHWLLAKKYNKGRCDKKRPAGKVKWKQHNLLFPTLNVYFVQKQMYGAAQGTKTPSCRWAPLDRRMYRDDPGLRLGFLLVFPVTGWSCRKLPAEASSVSSWPHRSCLMRWPVACLPHPLTSGICHLCALMSLTGKAINTQFFHSLQIILSYCFFTRSQNATPMMKTFRHFIICMPSCHLVLAQLRPLQLLMYSD